MQTLAALDAQIQRSGEYLESPDYYLRFDEVLALSDALLKTESMQTAREPGNPAWEAWSEGNRARTSELLIASGADAQPLAIPYHRLRLVEYPWSEYTVWELAALACQLPKSPNVALLVTDQLRLLEGTASIGDLVMMQGGVFRPSYLKDGTPAGAWWAEWTANFNWSHARRAFERLEKMSVPLGELLSTESPLAMEIKRLAGLDLA